MINKTKESTKVKTIHRVIHRFSFHKCCCVENYGPNLLFKWLSTLINKKIYTSKLKVPKSKALVGQRHFKSTNFWNERKQLTLNQTQGFKIVEEKQLSLGNQIKLGKIKSTGRAQNFKKLGKTVAAATIGDYLVNSDLWKTSSLSNRLFWQ